MKITTKATKGCGKLSPDETFFTGMCFSGVTTAEESNSEIVDYYGPVKTSHKGFFLATSKNHHNSGWESLILL